jgi:hypothetical protein
LYCGKEIGPFRLLRDREFCSPAHRQGYSARLGKALGQISAQEPPPAPIASFIPYKPFEGNNRTLCQIATLEPFRSELHLLATWPLSIVPMPRERTAPLSSPRPSFVLEPDFAAEPQPWPADKSLRYVSVELLAEDPLSLFEADEQPDPVAAGPALLDPPPAGWQSEPVEWPDAEWTAPNVRLPRVPPRLGAFVSRGVARGLLADAVEAFLPPGKDPEMLAFVSPPTLPALGWKLRAAELQVTGEPAGPATGPAPQPVESWLPPSAEAQVAVWPADAVLPKLGLVAADWTVAADIADAVPTPAAQPLERFLPAPPEPQIAAWAAAVQLPEMTLSAADWLAATAMAEPVAGPAAQAAESWLPIAPEAQALAWPAHAVALPRLTVAPAGWVLSVDLAELVSSPAPQAAESWLPENSQPQVAAWPPAAVALPQFALEAVDWVLVGELAELAASPAPQAAERWLPANPEPRVAAWPAAAAALPQFALEAVDWVLLAESAGRAASPAAEVVESLLPALAEAGALPLAPRALQLPVLALAVLEPEAVAEFVAPMVIADACQQWMASPPACEAVREVLPAFGAAFAIPASMPAPMPVHFALEHPSIRYSGGWRPAPVAEAVIAFVAPHLAAPLAANLSVAVPHTGTLQKTTVQQPQTLASPAIAHYPDAALPSSADLPVASLVQSAVQTPALRFPGLALEHATGDRTAPFRTAALSAAEPGASEPNRDTGAPQLDRAAVRPPGSPAPILRCGFELAPQVTGDFICQRVSMPPFKSLQAIAPAIAVLAPRFAVRPIFERVEEATAPPKPTGKTPAFAEIFQIAKVARKTSTSRTGLFSAGKLIAASLIVGLGMWFGAGSVKISRQMLAINIHGIGSTNPSSGIESPVSSPGFPAPKTAAANSTEGPIAKVRHAIQGRAALELTDTFRRMQAWGSGLSMPAGWTRNPDGYVRTGQLALYRPAQSFANYRFEFFGEIEKKSMSWAIRARDTQNYYGMKMTVIEPGLRPVVAMVHYAVVDGKRGAKVETPLSMMIHNNEAYHVAVEVKGNRVVTSIEGQEVDSWTADSLKTGGVGFFSEVGESARLYWMRVSRNQDWLGRVCAYLSSGSGNQTADLWRDEIPQSPAPPATPPPAPASEVAMAAAEEAEEFAQTGSARARILKYRISNYGRTELCRS